LSKNPLVITTLILTSFYIWWHESILGGLFFAVVLQWLTVAYCELWREFIGPTPFDDDDNDDFVDFISEDDLDDDEK